MEQRGWRHSRAVPMETRLSLSPSPQRASPPFLSRDAGTARLSLALPELIPCGCPLPGMSADPGEPVPMQILTPLAWGEPVDPYF